MKKAELRKKYKEMRLKLAPGEIENLSESIVDKALTHFQLQDKTISLFLPIERQAEINTYILLEKAINFGAQVVLGLPP